MIIEADRITFDNYVRDPCIVDFYTSGCPSCEKLSPVFEDLSEYYNSHKFLKVCLDEDLALAERYGITHVPTLILFDDGEAVKESVGFLDKAELAAFIGNWKEEGA